MKQPIKKPKVVKPMIKKTRNVLITDIKSENIALQTKTHTDRHTDRRIDRRTDRQMEKKKDRQKDRQTKY